MKKAGRPAGNKAASGGVKGDTVTAGTSAGKPAVKSPTTAPLSKVTSLHSLSNHLLVISSPKVYLNQHKLIVICFDIEMFIFDQQVKSNDDLLAAMAGNSAGANNSVAKGKKSTSAHSTSSNNNNPDSKTKTNSGELKRMINIGS